MTPSKTLRLYKMWLWIVKPVQKCLQPALSLKASSGAPPLVELYVSLWENDPTSHLIYRLSKQFSNELIVSVTSFFINADTHRSQPPIRSDQDNLPSSTLSSKARSLLALKTPNTPGGDIGAGLRFGRLENSCETWKGCSPVGVLKGRFVLFHTCCPAPIPHISVPCLRAYVCLKHDWCGL